MSKPGLDRAWTKEEYRALGKEKEAAVERYEAAKAKIQGAFSAFLLHGTATEAVEVCALFVPYRQAQDEAHKASWALREATRWVEGRVKTG